jgi:metal-responsive CopG/Arc/MetJ family transcriptional regulator
VEKEKNVVWNLQVPKPLNDAVEKIVLLDMHLTKAELIREAVRHYLNELQKQKAQEAATNGGS